MPCLYISTNVRVEGIDVDTILCEATKAVAQLTGKPQSYVMVLVKGGIDIRFGGSKEAAAFAEIVSMDAISSQLKRELIAAISTILHRHLDIPTTRFVLNLHRNTISKI